MNTLKGLTAKSPIGFPFFSWVDNYTARACPFQGCVWKSTAKTSRAIDNQSYRHYEAEHLCQEHLLEGDAQAMAAHKAEAHR